MAYIEYSEWVSLGGDPKITESIFDNLLPKASAILDVLTNDFYVYEDINTDPVKQRVQRFKLALVAQIEYMNEAGKTSFQVGRQPQSQSIGQTSVNYGSGNSGDTDGGYLLASDDVYYLLQNTGLLYRGVRGCRRC